MSTATSKRRYYFAVMGRIPDGENETRVVRASDADEAYEKFADDLYSKSNMSSREIEETVADYGDRVYVDAILRSPAPIRVME